MKNKLVAFYFLCSLIFGVFCIGGFAILSMIKNHSEQKPQYCGNPVYPENYKKISLVNDNIIFNKRCSSCHRADKWLIGPPLGEVAKKREPEWVFKWLTNKEALYEHLTNLLYAHMENYSFNYPCRKSLLSITRLLFTLH